MACTEITRRRYERCVERYASELTDDAWALMAPWMPMRRRSGRPRTTDLREVINAILALATTGCQWRPLPKDFPPPSTVQRYVDDGRDDGLWQTIRFHLTMAPRELES